VWLIAISTLVPHHIGGEVVMRLAPSLSQPKRWWHYISKMVSNKSLYYSRRDAISRRETF
jgi:hypothetical protein